MVAIHIERFVCVFHPSKWKKICSHKIFLYLVTSIVFGSLILNCHFIWTSEKKDSVCHSFSPEMPHRFTFILFTVITNSFLPNSILIVINILIIKKVRKVGKRVKRFSVRNDSPSTVITKKFIINSLVFVLIFLPLRVLNCYVVVYPEANYFGNIFYIRKIFSFLVCSYYSFFFLIHVFIMKHLRKIFNKRFKLGCVKPRERDFQLKPLRSNGE
jgi:hypothetical protein